MIVNIIFAVSLPFIAVLGLEIAGVALASSIAGFVNAGLLWYLLEQRIGKIDVDNKLFAGVIKVTLSSLVMGLAVHYSLYFYDLYVETEKVLGLLAQTMGAILVGVILYFGLTYLFKVEEAKNFFSRRKKVSD